MVMISMAVVAVAKRFFGSERGDEGDDVQGDDPIVQAMFKAVNLGELDDLEDVVHDDCRITLNSYELTWNSGQLDRGPKLWLEVINDLRRVNPDVRWDLYDEIVGKDEGAHKIAVRFVSTVTLDGEVEELEVAGFGIVEHKKLTEWHEVADMETFNRRRQEAGEAARE
jgi:hypothetical protein